MAAHGGSLPILPLLSILLLSLAGELRGQALDGMDSTFVTIGSHVEDRMRVDEVLGRAEAPEMLLRTAHSLSGPVEGEDLRIRFIPPRVQASWNSAIPLSLNDGSLWGGRGYGLQLLTGIRTRFGPAVLTFAPRISYVQNRDFDFIRGADEQRSLFLPPWRENLLSADLPLRFGASSFWRIDLGESRLAVDAGPVVVGFSTEEQWWGPGIRNAIVLSNNAGGFPHLFFGTADPIDLPIGTLAAKWIVGGLSESLYFDVDTRNDLRSMSAIAIVYHPPGERNLSLGFARGSVMRADDRKDIARRLFGIFGVGDDPDAIRSLFARWVFPRDGVEVYAEWAHHDFTSLRDFLLEPQRSQGYTLGLQWIRPLGEDSAPSLRLQAEVTDLEQGSPPVPPHLDQGSFYTSATVPQGYTHRGQVLGAAIGPGASSQFLAADFLSSRFDLGLFFQRVRWDNDALYQRPPPVTFIRHDVSILGGLRGGLEFPRFRGDVTLGVEKRLNYLFQNFSTNFNTVDAVDVTNGFLRLNLTPN